MNTPAMEFFPSLTDDGVLYFESNRDGTRRIYRAEPAGVGLGRGDVGFGPAELVEFARNVDAGAGNPLISPNGSVLMFSAEVPEGAGGSDLYVVCGRGEGWGTPEPLAA